MRHTGRDVSTQLRMAAVTLEATLCCLHECAECTTTRADWESVMRLAHQVTVLQQSLLDASESFSSHSSHFIGAQ